MDTPSFSAGVARLFFLSHFLVLSNSSYNRKVYIGKEAPFTEKNLHGWRMENKSNREGVSFYYIIGSVEFSWLKDNMQRYVHAYERAMSKAPVNAWISTQNTTPSVYFHVEGEAQPLEEALEQIFSSECGLPYAVLRPFKARGRTSGGFKAAEKVINRHGKRLKTKWEGALVQKIVCEEEKKNANKP